MINNSYLENILEELSFPEEARDAYRAVAAALEIHPEQSRRMKETAELLFVIPQDTKLILSTLGEIADRLSIPAATVNFYLYITATEELRELWRKMGLTEETIHNCLRDFRYKNDECHMFTGVWGSYSDGWLMGWFKRDRFAFGRLQFDTRGLEVAEATVGGRTLHRGDKVVSVHIPRAPEPFSPEARLEAYRMAYSFFKDSFPDEQIPFICGSWLLFPYNREILSPTSNTVSFADEFKLLAVYEADVWIRFIFGTLYTGNPDDLPESSSLHKGYKKFLKEGNMTGSGYGIFLFDGEKIVNE